MCFNVQKYEAENNYQIGQKYLYLVSKIQVRLEAWAWGISMWTFLEKVKVNDQFYLARASRHIINTLLNVKHSQDTKTSPILPELWYFLIQSIMVCVKLSNEVLLTFFSVQYTVLFKLFKDWVKGLYWCLLWWHLPWKNQLNQTLCPQFLG